MNVQRIVALAIAVLGATSPAPAAPASEARIVGTLVFREHERRVTPAEAQQILHGKRISLALRNGWDVVEARLEGDGRFTAEVAPGSWRLEWIDVGDRAEVLATPLALEARAGAPSCAGVIEIAYSDLESELGASAAGKVKIEPGCEAGPGGAVAGSLEGRFAPEVYRPVFGIQEVAEGLRAEAFFIDQEPGLRISWAVPVRRPLGWMGSLVALGGASRHLGYEGQSEALEAGVGFYPYWGAEVSGGLRWERGGSTAPWAGLRLGPPAYGFMVRALLEESVSWSFGVDLSAFHIVGRFF